MVATGAPVRPAEQRRIPSALRPTHQAAGSPGRPALRTTYKVQVVWTTEDTRHTPSSLSLMNMGSRGATPLGASLHRRISPTLPRSSSSAVAGRSGWLVDHDLDGSRMWGHRGQARAANSVAHNSPRLTTSSRDSPRSARSLKLPNTARSMPGSAALLRGLDTKGVG